MRKILLGLAAAASLVYARLFGGSIDGTAWDIKMKPDSFFSFSHKGTLNFADGKLAAVLPQAAGFSPGSYQAQSTGAGGTLWSAAFAEAEHGALSMQGLIRGDAISGVAVLWQPDGSPKRFLFKGTRHGE